MEGLGSQDDQIDAPTIIEATEVGAQTAGIHTDEISTFSAPPSVQSVPPRTLGMPPVIMMISKAIWTKIVT